MGIVDIEDIEDIDSKQVGMMDSVDYYRLFSEEYISGVFELFYFDTLMIYTQKIDSKAGVTIGYFSYSLQLRYCYSQRQSVLKDWYYLPRD